MIIMMKKEKPMPLTMVQCGKCGYSWEPRGETKPVSCPRCKRYDWGNKK